MFGTNFGLNSFGLPERGMNNRSLRRRRGVGLPRASKRKRRKNSQQKYGFNLSGFDKGYRSDMYSQSGKKSPYFKYSRRGYNPFG